MSFNRAQPCGCWTLGQMQCSDWPVCVRGQSLAKGLFPLYGIYKGLSSNQDDQEAVTQDEDWDVH